MLSPLFLDTAALPPFLLVAAVHTSCGLLLGQFVSSRQELLWRLAGSRAAGGLLTGDVASHVSHRQPFSSLLRLLLPCATLLRLAALSCAGGALLLGLLSPSCAYSGLTPCAASLFGTVLSMALSMRLLVVLGAAGVAGAALSREPSWRGRLGMSMD